MDTCASIFKTDVQYAGLDNVFNILIQLLHMYTKPGIQRKPRSPPNLISTLLYHLGPLHKISPQSVDNFLSNDAHKQTNKQKYRQTDTTENINLLLPRR